MNERYLTSFEDQTTALDYTSGDTTLVSPQVSLVGADEVVYSKEIPNESRIRFAKDETTGKLCFVVDGGGETDPTAGYVDLGLSVMWASCNLGASGPEELGDYLPFVGGCETLLGGHLSIVGEKTKLESDPIYQDSVELLQAMVHPRTPSPKEIDELLTNTTAAYEIYNNQPGTRYTAANGNSIFVPNGKYWSNAEHYDDIYNDDSNSWKTNRGVCWGPEIGLVNSTNDVSIGDNESLKSDLLMRRGVCDTFPKNEAIFLEYNTSYSIDTTKTYCVRKDSQSTTIISPIAGQILLSTDPYFSESSTIITRTFMEVNNQYEVLLTKGDVLQYSIDSIDNFLYIKFNIADPVSIMLNLTSTDLDNTRLIQPNQSVYRLQDTDLYVYRFRYDDFRGYDMTIKWNGNGILPVYLADTYSFELSNKDPHVLIYNVISRRGSYVVSAATLDEWATRVGEEGYLYARFDNSVSSRVTFQTEKLP